MNEGSQESLSDTHNRFFVTMAALLLVIVFVGFAPTFYLKIFFDTPELPWYVHLHGAVLSAWFMLFLTQTVLIKTKRTTTHRRLGVLAGVTAVLLVLMTLFMVLNADASMGARGALMRRGTELTVLVNLWLLTAFSVLVVVGISFRHRPAVHKRAMLLASIALVTPALGRIARFSVFAEAGIALVLAVLLSLMLTIWVHDFLSDKRMHATTVWGSALIFGGVLASAGLASTESGKAFVTAISLGSG